MIRRVDAVVDDLLWIGRRIRADEADQWEAFTGQPWDYRRFAVETMARGGIAFTLLGEDDLPLCAGGYDEVSPGVWQSWMAGTDEGWKDWRAITRASREVMDLMFEHGAHRLQTNALADRVLARRWYEKGLGMQHEGTWRRFTRDGRDVVCYARVKE